MEEKTMEESSVASSFVMEESSVASSFVVQKDDQSQLHDAFRAFPPQFESSIDPGSVEGMQALNKNERSYNYKEKPKQRKLKAIVNKLTPQNFDRLIQQVKDVNIDTVVTLTGVISLIFQTLDATTSETYANFCIHLDGVLPVFSTSDETITFKKLLVNQCQKEFQQGGREETEEKGVEELKEEDMEEKVKSRRRWIGNIQLIGELYKKRMFPEKIMHECIVELLKKEDGEAVSILMHIIGEEIDSLRSRRLMDAFFYEMQKLSNDQKLPYRVRFMLKDTIDLRKNKWHQRKFERVETEKVYGGTSKELSSVRRRMFHAGSGCASARTVKYISDCPNEHKEGDKQRQLEDILNKMTPQNFDKVFQQVKEVNIDSAATLTRVISQIFEKALMEPTFCELYANLCHHLAGALPEFSEDNEKITFKRLLLNKCQEEFERGEREQAEANRVEEGEIKQSAEEREKKRVKARRRMLGNIRLIGELYNKKMLTERIMHECIKKLLGQYQNPDEEDIEALCKLMSTIGEMIDHPKAKEHMDAYFDVMLKLSNNQKLSSRARFMLKDAIDLRKNKWQQRRKIEGPKKIEEVHRDAAQERQLQTSRLSRSGSGISSVRRGTPIDYGPRGSTTLSSSNAQQMSGPRSLPPQLLGYGIQDVRLEDKHSHESKMLSIPLPQRPIDDDPIALGPQGGLARGMSIRGQPLMPSALLDVSTTGDPRRRASGPNGCSPASDWPHYNSREEPMQRYMPERFMATAGYEQSNSLERNRSFGSRDFRNVDRSFDRSMAAPPATGRVQGSTSGAQNVPFESKLSEDHLRNMSISTIREYYRASGGSRNDRRGSGIVDDDKWGKAPGSFGSGRDPRMDGTHGGVAVNFRPGQAGNHGVLRNPRGRSSGQYVGGILSGPMQALASPGAMARNSPDVDRWQHAKGLIPAPPTPLQAMHKAERKYEIGEVSDREETKQRQLKAILYKLTPQNFDKVFQQVKEVNIDSAATLTRVISQIFDKALMEPTFCEMYANLCHHLAGALPEFSEDNERITFKRLLLNKCQEEFERGEREQAEANRVEEGEIKQSAEEREQKRVKARRRMLGNIQLIGELYNKKMLTERIMHECIKKLLGQYQNPDEEDIEALCKLMSTIGEMIDHPKAKEHMDAYFDMMLKLSNNQKLSSRVRFMLKDAIDLRKNKWQQRKFDWVETKKVYSGTSKELSPLGNRASQSHAGYGINYARRGKQTHHYPQVPASLSSQFSLPKRTLYDLPHWGSQYVTRAVPFQDGHPSESRTLPGSFPRRPTRVQSLMPSIPLGDVSSTGAPSDLRSISVATIREYYDVRDDDEVRLCIKELNAPRSYPKMVKLWIEDSFDRANDVDRDLLAKLLVKLSNSNDISRAQLIFGFKSVLSILEDAVIDSPNAAKYFGHVLGKVIVLESIFCLTLIGNLILKGGSKPGRLVQIGIASEILLSILGTIRAEKGESVLNEMWTSSNLRLEDFQPPDTSESLSFEEFIQKMTL